LIDRRLALGALAAAPLVAAAAVGSRRIRSTLVGARTFMDAEVPRGAFPKTLRGPNGDGRLLQGPPRRIVSTYLGADEVLAALVAPDRVVAVSAYVDDPATSNCRDAYPATIKRVRSDPEIIIGLDPDLVCVAGFTPPESLRLVLGAGLPVVRWSRFNSFADVMGQIQLLGAVVGEESRADTLAGDRATSPLCSRTSTGGWPARRGCASFITTRRPTRWGAARWSPRSWRGPAGPTSPKSWGWSARGRSASRPCSRWSRK
jgi:ABC-type Fe3+-hydroxamate transport system substrate-binding protein